MFLIPPRKDGSGGLPVARRSRSLDGRGNAGTAVTDGESRILNFYRASELHGGLVLSRLAGRCRDGALVAELLKHGAEEIEHARLWTETMLALGHQPRPTRDTYQRRYAAIVGPPGSVLHVLALTHVFERRVYTHFREHARRPDTHPLVRATLRRMIEEERGHLSWVRRWLDAEAERRDGAVERILERYEAADRRIYHALVREYGFTSAAPPALNGRAEGSDGGSDHAAGVADPWRPSDAI